MTGLVAMVSAVALALLAEVGFDPVFSARSLKRAIQERIENPLSRLILDGSFGPKDHVKVGVNKGQLTFDKGVGKATI
jgi:ATP-dependent Clp protease ATP-binding subunit ClpB